MTKIWLQLRAYIRRV